MMNRRLYEIAYENTTIYDGVHEFCTTEHVNEAHFRVSMRQKEKKHKPLIKIIMSNFAHIKGVVFNEKAGN